ncbi:exo-alpha-sialidase [Flavobacterium sp. WC2421]|uniref:exo-alpha-sialidase n=1 Tax=Flavobacterium sp. WC2421 TaxID=3234138 RepID=UPI0034654DDF
MEASPGVILCGSSTESTINNEWRAHVEKYVEATGEWSTISIENKQDFEIIQPTFLIHSKNKIQLLFRSKRNKIITSWSGDKGENWTRTDSINVVNSNSGIDALTISKKSFLLVNNPLYQGKDWFNGRNILDVEHSKDGVHWKKLFDLENQEKGEYSYPAIIQTADGKVHVLYTYNRKYIKHVSFELNDYIFFKFQKFKMTIFKWGPFLVLEEGIFFQFRKHQNTLKPLIYKGFSVFRDILLNNAILFTDTEIRKYIT